MTILLVAALSTQLVTASIGAAPDPCQLVTPAEIAAALGKVPSGGEPFGPKPDEKSGGTLWSCTRNVGNLVLDVSLAEVADAAAADKIMTTLAATEPDDEDEAKLVAASGVGDRSLFGATKVGAHWIAQRGKFMVAVSIIGELGDGARYREPLKRLAAAAVTRL